MSEAGGLASGATFAFRGSPHSIWGFSGLTWDVAWVDFVAPHKHMVMDVTGTSARTNYSVPTADAPLPPPRSIATPATGA
jgi:hypothetical protein